MYILDIYFRHIELWRMWQDQLSEAYINEFMLQNSTAFEHTLVIYVRNIINCMCVYLF